MENNNQKSIDALNNLLEINNDRIEGYKHALKETEESDLKTLFSEFANTSYKCQLELSAEVEKLGGKPVEGTRNTGKLYRTWMDLKAALTNKDRKAILNSCEYGEDVAVKNYEDTLKGDALETPVYNLVNSQLGKIKSEHDKIKSLRDSLKK